MANKDFPMGLQAVRTIGAGPPETMRLPLRQVLQPATPLATPIYKGQPVCWDISGWVVTTSTTAIAEVVGVAAEFYRGTGSTQIDIAVWDAKRHIFAAQADSTAGDATDALVGAALMQNFSLIGVTGGNTSSGWSTCEIDWSSGATTTKPLRFLGLHKQVGEGSGANLKGLFRFNAGYEFMDVTTSPNI